MIKAPLYRIYQQVLRLASYFLGIKEPEVISGEDSLNKIPDLLSKNNLSKPLVVTDKGIHELGLLKPFFSYLDEKHVEYAYFHEVVVNPTIENIENGLKVFLEQKCDSIIAIGGGSSMDAAKMIGARATNSKKSVEQMKGLLHVRKALPFLVAVPTTAGTGSETTLAAVVVNEKTHVKYAVNSPKLIPKFAVLDPKLLVGLPKSITAATGMDALTHAVEAYIGHSNTRKTKRAAIEAVKMINENLIKSYNEPSNLIYRANMQRASYLAGVAFTRAYVGYVHAIAHSLGGKYNIAHGLANAIVLPYVLEAYGKKAYKKLAKLSDEISLTKQSVSTKEKASAFIKWIFKMNKDLGIPEKLDIKFVEKDVEEMIKNAIKEGNPLYPVPKEFDNKDFAEIYRKILN